MSLAQVQKISAYWIAEKDYELEGGPESNGHMRYVHDGVKGVLIFKRNPKYLKLTLGTEILAKLADTAACTTGGLQYLENIPSNVKDSFKSMTQAISGAQKEMSDVKHIKI